MSEKHVRLVGTHRKCLLEPLDIWHTHGIIGDVQNDIRKVTLMVDDSRTFVLLLSLDLVTVHTSL